MGQAQATASFTFAFPMVTSSGVFYFRFSLLLRHHCHYPVFVSVPVSVRANGRSFLQHSASTLLNVDSKDITLMWASFTLLCLHPRVLGGGVTSRHGTVRKHIQLCTVDHNAHSITDARWKHWCLKFEAYAVLSGMGAHLDVVAE